MAELLETYSKEPKERWVRDEDKSKEQLLAELAALRKKLREPAGTVDVGDHSDVGDAGDADGAGDVGDIGGVGDVGDVGGASDRKRIADDLERRNRQLEAMLHISESARLPGDFGLVFNCIVDEVGRATDFEMVTLSTCDSTGENMLFLASIGIGVDLGAHPFHVSIDQTLCGTVVRTGCKIIVPNVQESSEHYNPKLEKLGIKTFLCFPISINGSIWGALSLGRKSVSPIEEPLVKWLVNLTDQIGILIKGKENERALRENEALLREVQKLANLGHYVFDISKDSWKSSETLDEILGLNDSFEYTYQGWESLLHPEDRNEMMGYFRNVVLRNRRPFNKEYRIVRFSDRQVRHVHGLGRLTLDEKGRPITMVGTIQDITDRWEAEKTLAESDRKFRTLFENSGEGILVADAETQKFLFANQTICQMLGYSHDEIIQMSVSDIHPAPKVQSVLAGFEAQIRGETMKALDTPCLRKDGSTFQADILTALVMLDNRKCNVGFFTDITERLKLESDKLQMERRLLHSQKLESLGLLAGGIAHDFNNLLMAVIGHANLARRRVDPASRGIENLQQIEVAAGKAADLARQLLAYSGRGKFVIETIDLSKVVQEMQHLLAVSVSKKADLRVNLGSGLPAVDVDPTQIRQIIMNLVINASEAIGEKNGTVSLSTGSIDCDVKYLKNMWSDDSLVPGEYIFLEIGDTGCGMDKNTQARIFDPFFTTKVSGRGLGLAAVIGIVRGHKGFVKVYSEPGCGSTFKVFFPASSHSVSANSNDAGKSDWSGTGRILLVDDEESVRDVGKALLQELGFEVETAVDGFDALTRFKNNPGVFKCVILDLTMPRIDGEETFIELRKLRADINVVISSGYNGQNVMRKFSGKGKAGFIQKPYNLSDLRKVLREIFDAGNL